MLRKLALAPVTVALALAAPGCMYLVRLDGLPGPRVREALPLDELAGRSGVPLVCFVAVWLMAGVLLALVGRWASIEPLWAAFAGAVATLGLVFVTTVVSIAVTRQVSAGEAVHAASRLEAVYLPAALVGVALAAVSRPRPHRRRLQLLVAVAVGAAAAVDLVHHLLPGYQRGLWHSLTPDAVGSLAAATGVCAGLALLVSARGLARCRRRAWEVAVALSALSMTVDVLHGAGPAGFVSGLVLILLVACRRDFVRPGDTATRFLPATRSAVALTVIAVYGVLALWIDRLRADRPFSLGAATREIWRVMVGLPIHQPTPLGGIKPWFSASLVVLGLTATIWVVGGWFAPWRHRVRQGARERSEARRLVHAFGADTLAPFTLRGDKAYYFAPDHRAFVAYRVVGGVAIVSGDPIGSPRSFEPLVASFVEHSHNRDWRVAILGASERWLQLYERHGLQSLYHGDEAVVEVERFSLEGRPIRKVRQSNQRLQRAGFTAAALRPTAIDPELRRQLEAIASDWRAGQPERGFVMALDALFTLGDDDAVFLVGRDPTGRPVGFQHFAIVQAGSALSLSSMPRLRRATPNGFNEWLICQGIAWARDHGFARVSLNFSPFAALLEPTAALSPRQRLARRALLATKGHFQLDNLLMFNRKFAPAWERRFLVYERRADLPRVSIAALAAEAYLPFQASRQ